MADAHPGSLGKRLRQERELRHWTQEELAEKIGRSVPSINRWEHDRVEPQLDALKELTALFGKPPERWGASRWNVPFLRNPYFTGREQFLVSLHRTLTAEKTVTLSQSRAISGLGGIGKTQIAIEYAYRYAREYEAVLWVQADSHEVLVSDFARLAQTLELPDKEEKEQWRIVSSVKRWLHEHSGWLLILDNADDLTVMADMLPRGTAGATLLTTRAQATGKLAQSLSVEKMELSEGMQLVLRRAKLLDPREPLDNISAAMRKAARQLVEELDGLPLALDQAGAYIEDTGTSLSEYLELYHRYHVALLQRQSSMSTDYPHTVASTWALSFAQVKQANPAAADLLQLCSFLHPDAIPEAIVTEGAAELGPVLSPVAADPLLLNGAIQVLRHYSLVKRDAEAKLLNMHRLVQVVLKASLDAAAQRQWAERSVRAVSRAFPKAEFAFWERCELCLPHALLCAQWIEEQLFSFSEAARLLHAAGAYLLERGQYAQAEPLLTRAFALREQVLGPQHPDTASTLNNLAWLYIMQGNYQQAQRLLQPALAEFERVLGNEHPEVASTLNILAVATAYIYSNYTQAEPLLQRALVIREQALGTSHPDVAESLHNLALNYQDQGNYEQAELLYQRALRIWEQQLGPKHPDVAHPLIGLANLYRAQGQYEQAEPLYQRSLYIREQALGPQHLKTAETMYGIAQLREEQSNSEEAYTWYTRSLAIREQTLGARHPKTTETRTRSIALLHAIGRHEDAVQLEAAQGEQRTHEEERKAHPEE